VTLHRFVKRLVESGVVASQSEIARRAGVSQGTVNKAFLETGEPDVDTCRKIAEAYPIEWADHLRDHDEYREDLRRRFAWAFAGSPPIATSRTPESWRAIEAFERLFALDKGRWRALQVVIQDLLAAAERAAANVTPISEARQQTDPRTERGPTKRPRPAANE
jgi:transcriptional regulator with XRE-family HTH domain